MFKQLLALLLSCAMILCATSCTADRREGKTHVIVISGQSNASGCSSLFDLKATEDGRYEKAEAGFENIRLSCFCDFHTETSDFEQTLVQFSHVNGFGPEIGMGLRLEKYSEKDDFYLLKTAWGGTSLAADWLNEEGARGWAYERSMNYIREKLEALSADGVVIDTLSICWMQGERDGSEQAYAEQYYERELALFGYFREDLKDYAEDIGIVDAGISEKTGNPYAGVVNEAKRAVCEELSSVVYLETNGEHLWSEDLGFDEGENSHYNSESMFDLGAAFAKQLIRRYRNKW